MAFDFDHWSRRNYLLVPAAVYNGNRFHALKGGYMPEYPPGMFFNRKLPLTISDEPRLSIEQGQAGKIELLTGNASTPAVCVYDPDAHQGTILLFDQRTRFGNNAILIEENQKQDRATIVIAAPGVRERTAEFGGFRPSGDTAADWKPGDSVTLRFKTYRFPARSIPDLLERFAQVRQDVTGPNQPRNLAPMSWLGGKVADRFRGRWNGDYYLPENSPDFQLGWVSGFMQTPMLALNDRIERQRMCRQIDFVTQKLQGPSGYFYAGITAGGKIRADRTFQGRRLVLTRKNADTLKSYIKQFLILRAQGYRSLIKPEWEHAAIKLAEAFNRIWKRDREFGQYLDPDTGQIAVYNSTGGAIVPGALAMAASYFHRPDLLQVAKESAYMYYRRDVVAQGLTGGHCGDISQDPDSESAFGFLDSLMSLYRETRDRSWLVKARVEANLAATWVLSYDEAFPPESQIANLGGHMAGAVFASTQNKHAAPGICTSSGDSLFRLYRATGQPRFAELLRNIQHAQVEATEFPGHPTCGMGTGASMERIQPTDAEGKGAIGNFIHTENAWTELDGLLMETELPGIYVQTGARRVFAFDHVNLEYEWNRAGDLELRIDNPTPFDADVSVFSETAAQARRPLSPVAYLGWPRVHVPSHGSIVVWVKASGRLQPAPRALSTASTSGLPSNLEGSGVPASKTTSTVRP